MASQGNNKHLRDQMALTTKHHRRPSSRMLLKDYLIRDDLSSCSSNGFKSFPRRQCCTTVRFDLLEKDLQAKRNRLLRPTTSSISHRSSCSFKVASSTISALHKASRAIISAVKLLPFPSVSPTSSLSYRKNSNSMKRLLSKSLSRKMLSRSFWRKAIEEEEEDIKSEYPRLKSFREFLEERDKPLDQHTQSSSVTSVTLESSYTSGSSGTSDGNSWGSSSEFMWEISRSTARDNNSDVRVLRSEINSKVQKSTTTAAKTTSGEDSTDDGCTLEKLMDWCREDKEQLSPVSVLNGPFGDDEEMINSPLDSTSLEGDDTVRGMKNKQMQKKKKVRHFDHEASTIKPINLEKRMTEFSEVNNEEKINNGSDEELEEEEAWMLIKELECSRLNSAEKNLIFDLFSGNENENEVTKIAKEWLSGESLKGMMSSDNNIDWEVCVREMDKCERWTGISVEQVGIQLEFEVYTTLMSDLVLELID